MTALEFRTATKTTARARLALIGPSGCGKTFTALQIAHGLGGKVAVIDTEHGSASKYAGLFEFDVLELTTFSPLVYVEAIKAAGEAGYDVLIIDSLTHEWSGTGGALEMVDAAAVKSKGNTYVAWGSVTPKHNKLIEAIIASRCHVIATMRSKTEYVLESRGGKQVPRKVGMAAIQRDGMDYEFDVVAEMDLDHNLVVTKTRCPALDGAVIALPDEALGQQLAAWLSDGESAAEQDATTAQSVRSLCERAIEAGDPELLKAARARTARITDADANREATRWLALGTILLGGEGLDTEQLASAREYVTELPDDTEHKGEALGVAAADTADIRVDTEDAPAEPEPAQAKAEPEDNGVDTEPDSWGDAIAATDGPEVLLAMLETIDALEPKPRRFGALKLWVARLCVLGGPADLAAAHADVFMWPSEKPARGYVLGEIEAVQESQTEEVV